MLTNFYIPNFCLNLIKKILRKVCWSKKNTQIALKESRDLFNIKNEAITTKNDVEVSNVSKKMYTESFMSNLIEKMNEIRKVRCSSEKTQTVSEESTDLIEIKNKKVSPKKGIVVSKDEFKIFISNRIKVSPPNSDFPADVLRYVKKNSRGENNHLWRPVTKYFFKDTKLFKFHEISCSDMIEGTSPKIQWSDIKEYTIIDTECLKITDTQSIEISKKIFSIMIKTLIFENAQNLEFIIPLLITKKCKIIIFKSTSILSHLFDKLIKQATLLGSIYYSEEFESKTNLVEFSQILSKYKTIKFCKIHTNIILSFEQLNKILQNLSFVKRLKLSFKCIDAELLNPLLSSYKSVYKIENNKNLFKISYPIWIPLERGPSV